MVYLYQFFLHIYEMFRNDTLIKYVVYEKTRLKIVC